MARAIWKATLAVAKVGIPVKLYSAAAEGGVHFRLLHATDRVPVKQRMVDPETGKSVAAGDIRKALEIERNRLVLLDPEDVAPAGKDDRRIALESFVPPQAIDLAWYERPYYLGADGSDPDYVALAKALAASGRIGLARWRMRRKTYRGALQACDGILVLVTLRSADEVVPIDAIEAPSAKPAAAAERRLAEQLVGSLQGDFDPGELRDEFRERVLAYVESKSKRRKFHVEETGRPRAAPDLRKALERSVRRVKERKVA